MSEKVKQAERPILTDISYDEFLTVIDNYVERSSRQSAEMSASTGMPRHHRPIYWAPHGTPPHVF